MKNISLPVFFILLLFAFLAYLLNRYLQRLIKPRASFGRFLLYTGSGFALAFAAVFVAVRLILWLFPPALK
jgi:hypothetical protein